MPIRITPDKKNSNRPPRTGRSSGGGAGGSLLPMLFSLFGRNPRMLLVVLVIGAAVYFLGGGNFLGSDGADLGNLPTGNGQGLGCNLNPADFEETLVFEPLSTAQLPRRVDLSDYLPSAGDQGRQGSCTAWACAYNARTLQEAKQNGTNPDATALSPAYLYNQLTGGRCTGTSIRQALELMKVNGLVPLDEFPYNDNSCAQQPNPTLVELAQQYRISGYNRLSKKANTHAVDLDAVKQHLAQGTPVVIGMLVGGSFYEMQGKKFWYPSEADLRAMQRGGGSNIVNDGMPEGFGGHAMCIVGYDDDLQGGALHIQNSWGSSWGENGGFWMRYADVELFTNKLGAEVYGLYPLAPKETGNLAFQASIGLVDNAAGRYIPITGQAGAYTYQTRGSVQPGTRFKIDVTNSLPCYTYVLGQETDGSSYVLFPYTEQHSAHCGITGRRLFPRDYSLEPDELGDTDYMAVILTRQEIDFEALNRRVNQASGSTYEAKLRAALQQFDVRTASGTDGNTAQVQVRPDGTEDNDAVLLVFAISKQ